MISARWYQAEACNEFWRFVTENADTNGDSSKNPLLVLPTGTGKSIIIALIVQRMLKTWPNTRCLMLTHVGELVKQNAEKMRAVWPEIDMGIHSASLGAKDLGHKAIFGTIQSVASTLRCCRHTFGVINLIIIDECHLLSEKESSQYRTVISTLKAANPRMRVLGLTATPYRMQGGLLTEQNNAIFTDVAYDLTRSLNRLIKEGYLSNLRTLHTKAEVKAEGLHTRGGDFKLEELEKACGDSDMLDAALLQSVQIAKAEDRRHWLCFIAGIENTQKVAQKLRDLNVRAYAVNSANSKEDNAAAIEKFRAGDIDCLVSADQLTTGFDVPFVDMLIMLRPTKSTALYVQIIGRALRPAEGKKDALILDFARNIERHGPINAIEIESHEPSENEKKKGNKRPSPVKTCPECSTYIPATSTVCPYCGATIIREMDYKLATDVKVIEEDLPTGMEPAYGGHVLHIDGLKVSQELSRNGNNLLKVTFLSKYKGKTHNVSTWLGFDFGKKSTAYQTAKETWGQLADTMAPASVAEALERKREIKQPKGIEVILRNFYQKRYYDEILRFIY